MPDQPDQKPAAAEEPALAPKLFTGRAAVATINDVAAHAGVSIKTVSRVVNREPNVRAEMAQRVQLAIRELDYRPNFSARNLAGRRAYLLALAYDNPNDSYLIGIQTGALRACRQLGYSLLLQPCTYDSANLIDDLLQLVRERRPSGLLLTPPVCDVAALLDALDSNEVDYTCIDFIEDSHLGSTVHANDQQGAYELTSYLLKLGHRRIAMIKAHPAHVMAQTRTAGFLQAHRDHGIEADPGLMAQGYFTFESGAECARVWLTQPAPPTAIFAANDDMAAGVLHVAHELGISVPAQLSVAGFDDTPVASRVWPNLTTVRRPIQAMAEAAAHILVSATGERARGAARQPRVETVQNQLIIRASTAPPLPR
jgi:LacI family transcriptional regulator